MNKVIVVGGGAAGMMAAYAAAENGAQVLLLERNEKLGKKVFITGKGRCNVTNACDVEELFHNIVRNPKFLYSSIYTFDNSRVMDFFEQHGTPLKVERGNRVFPQSDHSSDIIGACKRALNRLGVQVELHAQVKDILLEEDKVVGVEMVNGQKHLCDALIVATGGCSYSSTGSTGDGYLWAEKCGHKIVPCVPALVPFTVKEAYVKDMMGLSLKNVKASIFQGKKLLYQEFGEMLFTHFGVSGPLMLTASSRLNTQIQKGELKLEIDLKPALDEEQLDNRILRDFSEASNKNFMNGIVHLFPSKMIPTIVELTGIDGEKKVHEITREERMRLIQVIRHFPVTLTGLRGFDEAIITSGGIATKEMNPSTMESKKVKGLYFAGEVVDVDAVTGGFNLQIAWSTGYLAGMSAAFTE